MTKRVLKFKLTSYGWYESSEASHMKLCRSMLREYFDVGKAFDMYFSTTRPTDDDEYYVLEESYSCWYLMEGPDKGETPTTGTMDHWLTEYFAGKRVYVWAVG